MGLGSKQVAKKMDGPGKRGYAGLLCAISFCLELRKSGKSATQRELYYLHKGGEDSPWRTQGECNESVADAATIFDCPRFALGITTSARGCCAGRLRWRTAGRAAASARGGRRFRRAVDSKFFAPLAGARGRAPSRRRR